MKRQIQITTKYSPFHIHSSGSKNYKHLRLWRNELESLGLEQDFSSKWWLETVLNALSSALRENDFIREDEILLYLEEECSSENEFDKEHYQNTKQATILEFKVIIQIECYTLCKSSHILKNSSSH